MRITKQKFLSASTSGSAIRAWFLLKKWSASSQYVVMNPTPTFVTWRFGGNLDAAVLYFLLSKWHVVLVLPFQGGGGGVDSTFLWKGLLLPPSRGHHTTAKSSKEKRRIQIVRSIPQKTHKHAPKSAKYAPQLPKLPLTTLRGPDRPDVETFCPPIGAPLPPERALDIRQPAVHPKAVRRNLRLRPQDKYPKK